MQRATARRIGRGGLALLAAGVAAGGLSGGAHAVPIGPPQEVAGGLNVPWEIAVAPDGRSFVTERGGSVRVLSPRNALSGPVLSGGDAAFGGNVRKFLGLALDPGFATNRIGYLYVSIATGPDLAGDDINGRSGIWRVREEGGRLVVLGRVFDGIDSDGNHDGGRMTFGPDGKLYVTTGDVHDPRRPQDPNSLNGKVLRFDAPASGPLIAPADNPFRAQGANAAYVWSLGHRHPQGLAFDGAGRLWETEHGPSGEQYGAAYPGGNGKTGRDELNRITRGGNYGWPLVSGPERREGTIAPVAVAGDSPAWAPAGLAVGGDGSLYAPFLAGQRLQRFDLAAGAVSGQAEHMTGLGRLRVAVRRGDELLVAQDGPDAKLFRLPLTPAPAGGTAPLSFAPPPQTAVERSVRARVKTLRERLVAAVRRLGARRLAAGRTVRVRAGGLPAGRVTVQLRLRTSKGPVLATRTVRVRDRGTVTYRLKLGRVGRQRLRATRSVRKVLRVEHRTSSGARTTVVRSVRLARLR